MDLESKYREKLHKTVVFWGFTSTTGSMDALDSFIPADSPTVCHVLKGAKCGKFKYRERERDVWRN